MHTAGKPASSRILTHSRWPSFTAYCIMSSVFYIPRTVVQSILSTERRACSLFDLFFFFENLLVKKRTHTVSYPCGYNLPCQLEKCMKLHLLFSLPNSLLIIEQEEEEERQERRRKTKKVKKDVERSGYLY